MPHALSLSLVALAAGCRTTIPETDTSPARVELRISGPGVGSERMSNPPFSLWVGDHWAPYIELEVGAEYRFALIVSDDGGVARAHLRMPIELELLELASVGVVTDTDAFIRRMTVFGSRAEPRSELSIVGRLRPRVRSTTNFAFQAEGDNFGGRSGRGIRTFLTIESFVVSPGRARAVSSGP